MNKEESHYQAIGKGLPGAIQSQMFGTPCFKVNGKAFISLFQDEMVFKLPGTILAIALSLAGSRLFDPSGRNRPMKEWVQVPFAHADRWEEFASEALRYVAGN